MDAARDRDRAMSVRSVARLSRSTCVAIALTVLGYLAFAWGVVLHERTASGKAEQARLEDMKAKADSTWGAGSFQPWRWK